VFQLPSALIVTPNVILEGSGQEATLITFTGSTSGAVEVQAPGAMRDLAVSATASSGSGPIAIHETGSGVVVLQDLRATAAATNSGGGAVAIDIDGSGQIDIQHVTIAASGNNNFAQGLLANAGQVSVSNSQLSATATNASGNAIAANVFAVARIQGSELLSSGTAGAASYGVAAQGTGQALVAGSLVGGQTNSVFAAGTAKVAVVSSGTDTAGVGPVTCFNSVRTSDFTTPRTASCG
jgi:hypothetical protein